MRKLRYLSGLILWIIAVNTFAGNSINMHIEGLEGDALKNTQARLNIVRHIYPEDISVSDIESLYRRAPAEIRQALQPYGYFHPSIKPQLTHQDDEWTATFDIQKGPALRITQLDVQVSGEGKDNKTITNAIRDLPIKKGDVLQTAQYEQAKDLLFNACNNEGYIKAFFDKTEILIDLHANDAHITIHLQTGRRYYFGKTTFGQSPYASSFLNRFITYTKGKPFSNKKLIQLQQDMASSYYFNQVNITPDFNTKDSNQIPININSTAPKSQRYNIGLGYGTFSGPRMTAGVSLRRLTDTGQHLDANMRLSSVLSGLSAKYYIPGANPMTDRWILGANYQKFVPKNGDSRSKSLSIGHIRKIHNYQTSMSLNYLIERYTVLNQPNRNSNLLYPNLTIGYINADDLINPRHGYSVNMKLQGASEHVYSSTRFFQGDLKGKYIVSPFDFAKIIARGEVGYTLVHDLNKLPLSMRFIAGGMNSIRGFADSSIGPGKYLQIGSLEYQNKIYGNVSGAAFYDFGSASDHFGSPINKGAGVGLIYNSVVGPIKIYLGRAISKKKSPYDVEFSVGPEF